MNQSISDIPKKRGRPSSGGRKTGIMVRLPDDDLAKLDLWIEHTCPGISRPEAIRQIMHEVIGMLDWDRAKQIEERERQAQWEIRAAKRKR